MLSVLWTFLLVTPFFRRIVAVVVVVRTCVYDKHVSPCKPTDASNYGSRVPVDTAPGPVPVYRALKMYPSFQLLRPTAGTGRCGITATSTHVEELHENINHGHLSLHTTGV